MLVDQTFTTHDRMKGLGVQKKERNSVIDVRCYIVPYFHYYHS